MNSRHVVLLGALGFGAIAAYLEVNGGTGGLLWLACFFCFVGAID